MAIQAQTAEEKTLGPKGEATRARLLAAAEEVFGEVGFDRASVSEITRRAGVAQGTYYLYFSSKREIFSELVRQIGRNLRRHIQQTVSGLEKRKDIEREGFRAFFAFVREHPAMYRIVRQAEFVDREAFRDYYESFATGYVEGLKRSKDVRNLDPEVVAWCVMGMGDLLGIRWILFHEDGEVPDKVLDTMIELISEGFIRGSEPASG